MIDIHSHILPYIDDGADTMTESIRMCEIAADNNVSILVATPHFYSYNKIGQLTEMRDEAIRELNGRLEQREERIRILPGFEVYCKDEILGINDFSGFTLNNSRYMLCEFDFNEPDALVLLRYIDHIISRDIIPIIAHPERYIAFMNDYDSVNDVAARGVLFQSNIGSFTGDYGSREMRLAKTMLECGFCDFLATDAHSSRFRSTNFLEMLINSNLELDGDELKRIADGNQRRILQNESVGDFRRGYITYDAKI